MEFLFGKFAAGVIPGGWRHPRSNLQALVPLRPIGGNIPKVTLFTGQVGDDCHFGSQQFVNRFGFV
jgi:hypothetical protein